MPEIGLPAARGRGQSERVLLVAVGRGLSDVLRDVLRRTSWTVARASDPAAALARLAAEPFDLVILEHVPGGLGIDAAAVIHALRRQRGSPSRRAWVLVLGQEIDADSLFRLRDAGASAILTGTLSIERITQRLEMRGRDERPFVDSKSYVGPDRRFRAGFYPPQADRRGSGGTAKGEERPEEEGEALWLP